jgi:hypothetical protein
MLAASCLPNGVKVRILILPLEHLSIDVSYAGPEHFQLGRDSFMMQVCFFSTDSQRMRNFFDAMMMHFACS